jgi:hypothetical protein
LSTPRVVVHSRFWERRAQRRFPGSKQLEELAEVSERCRKVIWVSKAATAGGILLPLSMMLGLFGSNQVAAIGPIAVVLGGIVSLGSNVSTLQQTMSEMRAAVVGQLLSPAIDQSSGAPVCG